VMTRDSTEYADDGNWAFATWATADLTAPAAGFDAACIDCHSSRVGENDNVFTRPGVLPAAFLAGAPASTTAD
jgi:hypothetical protein